MILACLLLASLAALAPSGAAAGTSVIGLRYWTAPDHTRIVIDLASPATYTHRTMTGPHRIVVEIPGSRLADQARRVEVGDGLVDRIRTNALRSGTAQVVVDLPEGPSYKIFSLKRYRNKPDRIVIDVMRPVAESERAAALRRVAELKERNTAIVVIDPGHGGEDPGAVAPGRVYEKDITLKVCSELARLLEKHPGVEVFLTRTGDYFVSLQKRQDIAREMRADLFLSVHTNAAPVRDARGAEVFFLSMSGASDAAARALAEAENAADRVGGVSTESQGDIGAILCDLSREDALKRSSRLSEIVYDELRESGLTRMRKVKQAGFAVLKTIQMPAVLVELGFLSSPTDRKNLCRSAYQRDLAKALARSVRRYLELYPPGEGVVHVVARGENLWRIARTHGTTVQDLKRLNHLDNADRIVVGQRLRVR